LTSSSTAPVLVEVFYDIGSMYSYFACSVLHRYTSSPALWRGKVQVKLRPCLIGGIFKATGNQMPAALPARRVYVMKDTKRTAEYMRVPAKVPLNFPANTLKVMRLLTSISMSCTPTQLEDATDALFRTYWVDNDDISEVHTLQRALIHKAHFSPAEAEAHCNAIDDPDVKKALRKATDEAVRRGAFGCPTFFVKRAHFPPDVRDWMAREGAVGEADEEMFFGADRINQMAFLLRLPWKGPGGTGVEPSSQREEPGIVEIHSRL